jgi:hypothetical protein
VTPLPSQAPGPTKQPAIFLSPEHQLITSPSPPPSTQARHAAPTHPIIKKATRPASGKPMAKKTAMDRFNDSRQDESRRLNLKRKMEHDEKMASIHLKRHKYDLRYGPNGTPQTLGSSTPVLATRTAAATAEDKQIEILRLQIRLAELTRDNTASAHPSSRPSYASSSRLPQASSSRALSSHMPLNCLDELSTPSTGSGMSSLSYRDANLSGHGYNHFMTASEDPGRYHHVPNCEASSVGTDMTSWPETYNFEA